MTGPKPWPPEPTPYPPWESSNLRQRAYEALWDVPAAWPIGTHPQTGERMVLADLTAKLDAREAPPGFVLWFLGEKGLLLQPVHARDES